MRAYIDYLRLATFDQNPYLNLTSRIYELERGWRPGKWLQYAGKWSRHLFHGVGLQNGRRHYVIQCSGDLSVDFAEIAKTYGQFYATRIDIQRTIEKGEKYDPLRIYNDVKSIPGNNRSSSVVLSSTGSTIYFGNRSSDTFARLYEKTIDEHTFIRLELEIKGLTAREAWQNIIDQQLRESEIFEHLFYRFKLPDYIKERFQLAGEKTHEYQKYEEFRYRNSKMEWLSSLENTIVMMGNDHQIGWQVKALLEKILERIDGNNA